MTVRQPKRQSVRFIPEPNTIVWLSTSVLEFHKDIVGLADSESQKGCGAVFNQAIELKEGDFCLVKVGDLAPLKGQVVWVKKIEDKLYRVGFQFLE